MAYGCVDRNIRKLFYRYGLWVYKWRWLAITIPLLITAVLAGGLHWVEELTNVNMETNFSPVNSRWEYEKNVFNERFPLQDMNFFPGRSFAARQYIDVILGVKKGIENDNVMDYLDEAYALNNEIESLTLNDSTVTLENPDGKMLPYQYMHLCVRNSNKGCYSNAGHLKFFSDNSQEWLKYNGSLIGDIVKETITSSIKVKYPISQRGDSNFYIGNLLGDVRVAPPNGSQPDAEKAYDGRGSYPFTYAKTIRLVFTLMQTPDMNEVSMKWKLALQDYILQRNRDDTRTNLTIYFFHEESSGQGILEIGMALLPLFSACFVILAAFATLCSLVPLVNPSKWCVEIDWVRSKPIIALVGVLTAGMAVISSFGLLMWCGFTYNHVIGMVPFLLISIGVDDMFIITAAWHRTRLTDSAQVRLGHSMADAAVSITITSLTDLLSFAIGCSTPLPAVSQFCAYCALAIAFNYFYQITFFTGLFSIAGDWESEGRHCLFPCHVTESTVPVSASIPQKMALEMHNGHMKTIPVTNSNQLDQSEASTITNRKNPQSESQNGGPKVFPTKDPSNLTYTHPMVTNGSNNNKKHITEVDSYQKDVESDIFTYEQHHLPDELEGVIPRFFRKYYGPFITYPVSQVGILLLYLAYVGVAIWGCTNTRRGYSTF